MTKKIFIVYLVVGIIVISILSFLLPNNPTKIIPAILVISFNKPLWFCLMFSGIFFYIAALSNIYEHLKKNSK